MDKLLLTLVMIGPTLLPAQTWCPPGATWFYTDSSYVGGTPGYRVLHYVQDTTIAGQPAQQMSNTWYRLIGGILDPLNSFTFHTYQEGEVIYCKTELAQPWDTLYWFGAVPGDHWHFPGFTDADPCDRMQVLDTGHVVMGGASLRYLDYEHDSAGVWVVRRITERLGDSYSFWPQPQCGLNEVKRGLRCYSDDELGAISTGLVPTCDYTTFIAEASAERPIAAHPTPGRDGFYLTLPAGTHELLVMDLAGHAVTRLQISALERLDTAPWPAGGYVLQLPGLGRSFMWIKE